MRSIWNNAFHSTPPALSWTYEVIFDELLKPIFGGAGYDIPSRYLTEAVVSINIPDRETETESVYYGGLEFPLYTRHKNAGTFTIKFNENALYEASNALDILYSAYAFNKDYLYCKGGANELDEINGYSDGVYPGYGPATITVNIFDPSMVTFVQGATGALANEVIVRRIRFEDCKILSIGGFTLDYESTDTITREVTFSYAKMIDGYIPEDEEVESNDSSNDDGSPNEDARGDGSNEQKVPADPSPAAAAAAAAGQAQAAARESGRLRGMSEAAAARGIAAAEHGEEAAGDAARAAEEAAWAASEKAKKEASERATAAAAQAAEAENVASEQANIAHEAAAQASREKASAYAASQRANKEFARAQQEEAARKAAYEGEIAAEEAAANASKAMEAARAADAAYARSKEAAARAQAAASAAKRR